MDGENGAGNRKSIGIEIAEVYGADKMAIKFIAELMKVLGFGIDKIVPHKNWSGKNCPRLILPHWNSFLNDLSNELGVEEVKVEYKKYSNGMTELKGSPQSLTIEVVDKKIWDITEFTNCTNGTFYWHDINNKSYATSILYNNGKLYQAVANHFPNPQSVFIIYKDGKVDLKRIKNISELDINNIQLTVGGVGLRNTQDDKFYYSPVTEGFSGVYADVLRRANKTVLGYNKKLDKCYLLTIPNVTHGELINLISQGEEHYDIAISLDGGGSTFMNAKGDYVFKGQATRRIHNIIRFK